MDKPEDNRRYRWSSSATNLLVSIWCHDLVQNQLKLSTRNQPIWESIARYMSRKGYSVTGLQCRTRIKNMLCSYHECVKKNDLSGIEPYYDIFKKVLEKKKLKRKDIKLSKIKEPVLLEESSKDNEISLDSNSFDEEMTQNLPENECDTEFLDISMNNSETINSGEDIKDLANLVLKAIDSQTKAITNAINLQTQTIEKLLTFEREKLELMVSSERENRKEIEAKLDKLLSKFDVSIIPQVTYMGTLIDTRQAE